MKKFQKQNKGQNKWVTPTLRYFLSIGLSTGLIGEIPKKKEVFIMDFKIEKYGTTVVMISFNNKTCLLPNETIKELQGIETAGLFERKLLAEIRSCDTEMAEALKSFLKNPQKVFEIMNKIKAYV